MVVFSKGSSMGLCAGWEGIFFFNSILFGAFYILKKFECITDPLSTPTPQKYSDELKQETGRNLA